MKELHDLARSAERYANEIGVKADIHLDDFIFMFLVENKTFDSEDSAVRYFFNDGRSSARKLALLIQEIGLNSKPNGFSILEFASGYGCVTRHLKAEIPNAHIVACDIHQEAVKFIQERLNTEVILSHSNPTKFKCNRKFDLVFALSFFSHMPYNTWGKWIKSLYNTLEKGGALIFTTQGLESAKYFSNPKIPDNGFWFRPDSEQKDLDVSEYGQTIVTESFVRQEVFSNIGKFPDLYRPKYWWDHQDLYVVFNSNCSKNERFRLFKWL